MTNDHSILSRDNSLVLRGLAIVFIVLHNFLHLSDLTGFTEENEMAFKSDNAIAFIQAITGGSGIFGEFFSYLGWIGVPVFIFLSGYGLALKNPPSSDSIMGFIKKHYVKLLVLMLPAILFFAAPDVLKGYWPGILKRGTYLIMVANFVYPYVNCNPGVYWYFGFAFQLYVLWGFFGRHLTDKVLLLLSIASLAGLFLLSIYGTPEALSIYKHCFTGWFPLFAIGVWLGKARTQNSALFNRTISVWIELLLSVILLGIIILLGQWLITWLFVPIVALAWFWVLGSIFLKMSYFANAFRWIGDLSASIFVCHPIARLLVFLAVFPYYSNLPFNLIIYCSITIVLSLAYRKFYRWFLPIILR